MAMPSTSPARSRTGDAVIATSIRPPSARMCTASRRSTCRPADDDGRAGVPVRGRRETCRPSDLVPRVAVEPVRRRVPAGDDARHRAADDRVVRGIDDGGEPGAGLLRAPPLRDVAHRRDRDPPALGLDGGERDLRRELASVAAPGEEGEARDHRPCAGSGGIGHAMPGMRGEALGHQLLDGPPHQILARIAEEDLGLSVDQDDPAIRIDPQNRIGSKFEQLLEVDSTFAAAPGLRHPPRAASVAMSNSGPYRGRYCASAPVARRRLHRALRHPGRPGDPP